jgi:transposase InsO family protein
MSTPLPVLPRDWPKHTKNAVLHVTGLAHAALARARGWCADSRIARVRLAAKVDHLEAAVALLKEELRIKDARMARIAPERRPHYPPAERLAVLALRAARCWTAAETARHFLLSAATIAAWMKRLDDDGPDALVRVPVPVNRFPDFVRLMVAQLGATLPSMGKVRIAQILARAGLHLAASTVKRMRAARGAGPPREPVAIPADLAEEGPAAGSSQAPEAPRAQPKRTVTARYSHHVWNVDLTVMPTAMGLWVPWLPQALVQRWPFAWWPAVVLDHRSRAVVATDIFRKEPTATEVCAMLDRAVAAVARAPKYTVTDQGAQFQAEYRGWCERHGVKPRFGAVGKHGSIAVVERFIRTLKDEGLRRHLVPFALHEMQAEVAAFVRWYNDHRPHQALKGATPAELRDGARPASNARRLEPRPLMPLHRRPRDGPRASRCRDLRAVVDYVEGRHHLPIVSLRRAA